jgi:3-deoxy-D-manno-octulosonic-acid transferase
LIQRAFRGSDAAFVSGSLLDFGCQNFVEPCAVGVPAFLGPSPCNIADAARAATE